jgi:hypothetical protein
LNKFNRDSKSPRIKIKRKLFTNTPFNWKLFPLNKWDVV